MSTALPFRCRLPYPVSANNYKRVRVLRNGGVMWYLTEEAQTFKAECGWRVKAAGWRGLADYPVALDLVLHPVAGRAGVRVDVDNALKVALDALQGIVYANDREVYDIRARLGDAVENGALGLTVDRYQPPDAPLFSMLPADGSAPF